MSEHKNPKATTLVIITKDNLVLMTKRNNDPYRDYWCIPGGHIEPNEKAKDAIIRETKEEVGLTIDPTLFTYSDEIIPKLNWHAVGIVFHAEIKDQEVQAGPEVSEWKWCTKEQALAFDIAFENRAILEEWFKKNPE